MPTPAVDLLMQEHRLIEQVLSALASCARKIGSGGDVDRATVKDFGDFFANFADKCHHAKEEDQLFVKMVDCGMPRDEGPIGVMLVEHDEGRRHVRGLRAIGAGDGPLTPAERAEVVEHALAFVDLLREHIMKEDQILYPMAENIVPRPEMDRLKADFDAYDSNVMGADHARYHALARTLVASFGV
jgi:hemerythrin-like domain-containing protein